MGTTLSTMATHGLDQPMFDQYRQYLALLEQPFPQSLLMLDNGHRPVLPALVRWLDLHAFGGGQHLANGLAMLLLAVNAISVAALSLGARSIHFAMRAALAALALFALTWLAQARMLVQGSEAINVQIIVLCLIVGALAISKAQASRGFVPIATALLAAAVATFTFGPGIAVFPALLLVGYARGISLRGLVTLAVGLVATLAVYSYVLPGNEGVREVFMLAPLDNLRVAAQWLAAPWVVGWLGMGDPALWPEWASANAAQLPQGGLLAVSAGALRGVLPTAGGWWSSSALIGIGGFTLASWVTVRALARRLPQEPVAALLFAFMLFGAACALLIGMTRLAYFTDNPGQVFADRYLPWSCLFWLGLAGSLMRGRAPHAAEAPAGMRYAVGACVIALLLLPTHVVYARWASSVYWHAERLAASIVASVPDPAVMPHPAEADLTTVQRTVAALKSRGLAMYTGHPDRVLGTTLAAAAPASTPTPTLIATRYLSAFDGSPAVYLHGETTHQGSITRAAPLWVIDTDGRVVGYGTLAGSRPGWTTWSAQHRRRLTIDAYARMPSACAPLTVLAGRVDAARMLARIDPCADPTRESKQVGE